MTCTMFIECAQEVTTDECHIFAGLWVGFEKEIILRESKIFFARVAIAHNIRYLLLFVLVMHC